MRAPRHLLVASLVIAMVLMTLPTPAFASVSITPGTGGAAISADTAAEVGGSFTFLTNPSLRELSPGDISTGSLTLSAPAGFELRRQRVTVYATPGGSSPTSLTLSASPGCDNAGQTAFLSASASEVTVHVCSDSTDSGRRTRLTFSGLAVRPLLGSPLASGRVHVDPASTATIAGVQAGPAGTSFADLATVPGDLVAVSLHPTSASLTPETTQQFTASATDQFGNARTEGVALAADPAVGTITPDGLFTAGTTVASATQGVTATAGDITAAAAIDVVAGPLAALALSPTDAVTTAGTAVEYAVEAFDAHGNSRGPADDAVLTLRAAGGDPVNGATCTALACRSELAGTFEVTATVGDVSTSTPLTVEPAALDRIDLVPADVSVEAGGTQQFEARAADAFGNARADEVVWDAAPVVGSIDAAGLLTAATATTARVPDAVSAAVGDILGAAAVAIEAGPVADLRITAPAEAVAGADAPVTVEAFDEFDNPIGQVEAALSLVPVADASAGGATCSAAACRATDAGTYDLVASHQGVTRSVALEVVPAAAAALEIAPQTARVVVAETVGFDAVVTDAFGNVRDDVVAFTAAEDVGTISAEGLLTAGTRAGVVLDAVTATLGALTATADVEVLPGAIAALDVQPDTAAAVAGADVVFTTAAADRFGNAITDHSPVFGIAVAEGQPGATEGATCATDGACRATRVGTYTVTAAVEDVTDSATLTVTPADLARVVLFPEEGLEVTAGEPTMVEGVPYDAFGNVRDDVVTYAIADGVGTIDADGNVVAGGTAGTFPAAITATVGDLTDAVDVTILAADVERLTISPVDATAVAGTTTAYVVEAFDRFDNAIGEVPASLAITPGDAGAVEGASCDADACTATAVGTYQVTATFSDATVTTSLVIEAAPLATITVTPAEVTAVAGETTTFQTAGADQFGNLVPTDATPELVPTVGGATAGATCTGADCSAERAGAYAVRVTDATVDPPVSGEATLEVVAAALDQVEVIPATTQVPVTGTFAFTGNPIDRFGNPTGDVVTFSTLDDRVGTITPDGVLTAGEVADFYNGSIQAQAGDFLAFADVETLPAAVESIRIVPGASTITAGDSEGFAVEGLDRHGNSVGAVDATFTIVPIDGGAVEGASCDDGGTCTAAAAGTYEVTATHGPSGATDTATLEVEAGAPAQVLIDPAAPTVRVGEQVQLTGIVTDAAGNPVEGEAVTWTADPAAGTITVDGLFTAGETVGTVAGAITAAAGDAVGTADVTVVARELTRIEISPAEATAVAGEVQDYRVLAFDDRGEVGEVDADLSISPQEGASCDQTSCTATAAGEHVVTASFEGLSDSAVLTVVPAAASSVALSPGSVSVPVEGAVQLEAVVADGFGNVRSGDAVTFAADVAAGSVDQAGVFTAGTTAGEFPGGVSVSVDGTDLVASADVTVLAGTAARIELAPEDAVIAAGERQGYTAQAFDVHDNPLGVVAATLSISPEVAGASCDADGCSATQADEYAVTASSDGLSDTATLTVVPGPPATLDLQPGTATVVAGTPQAYTVTAADAFGNDLGAVQADIAVDVDPVHGSCDAAGVCTVTLTGEHLVTATAGEASDTAGLTVTPDAPAAIVIDPTAGEVVVEGQIPFTATVTDQHGNAIDGSATWSADPAAGTIDPGTGLFTAGTTAGTFTAAVTATADGLSAAVDVTVLPGGIATLVLDPSQATVPAGGAGQAYTATGADRFGNPTGAVDDLVLTLSHDSLESFNASCQGSTCGGTTVATYTVTGASAAAPEVTGTATLTITAGPVASFTVLRSAESVNVTPLPGNTAQVTAVATDAFGNPVQGVTAGFVIEVAASSTAGRNASLSAPSAVTGPDGRATVTYTAGGQSGSDRIAVTIAGTSPSTKRVTIQVVSPTAPVLGAQGRVPQLGG